jgi:lycopene beta-cyclase
MVPGYLMAGNLKEKLECNILICGAGMAGLSLVYRGIACGKWQNEKIIIVDPSSKEENDKTWSFWKKNEGPFDDLIFKSWTDLSVFSNSGERISLDTGGYTYNSIRSVDFYQHTRTFLKAQANVTFLYEPVQSLTTAQEGCLAETSSHQITAAYAFNSIFESPKLKSSTQYFLQHFKGLIIKSPENFMKENEAFLMDFRTDQSNGTTFFYTLPLGNNELFVEYTLFSKQLLDQSAYDDAISEYLNNILKLKSYKVLHTEFGVIPMTDHQFSRFNNRIINIGTIGGDTRGATGYTFTNVQKTITKILEAWTGNTTITAWQEVISWKHKLYDSIMLNVLNDGKYAGHQLFCDLFKNAKAHYIFKFLDGETGIPDDLRIITSLKPVPFVHALGKVIGTKSRK